LWRTTTPRQWSNYGDLRTLVKILEDDLTDKQAIFSHFNNPTAVQRIAFNILLSLTYWNWDAASYVPGMVTFLSPFLDSFIDSTDGPNLRLHDGEVLGTEEAEADIFWCFVQFYDLHQLCHLVRPSPQPLLKPLFMTVGNILQETYPDLLQLLYQKHAFSLDFMRDDCSNWFTSCFEGPDLKRLWTSVLASPSSFQFFQCFIIAMLFAMVPSLIEANPLNSDDFAAHYEKVKRAIGLTLLLENTTKLMEKPQASASKLVPK
jgi:hypothetical protein